MKKFIYLSGLLFMLTLTVTAQMDKQTVKKILENKRYQFVATSAIPMEYADLQRVLGGMAVNGINALVNLTNDQYTLKISPDTLQSYLPFFGRAYSAPINQTESGYKFTSTDFSYLQEKTKKGAWKIQMIAKDAPDRPSMTLTVSQNGYGTLVINSINKQSITFNGHLSEGN